MGKKCCGVTWMRRQPDPLEGVPSTGTPETQWGGLLALGLLPSHLHPHMASALLNLLPVLSRPRATAEQGLSWKPGIMWGFFFPCSKALKPVITLN